MSSTKISRHIIGYQNLLPINLVRPRYDSFYPYLKRGYPHLAKDMMYMNQHVDFDSHLMDMVWKNTLTALYKIDTTFDPVTRQGLWEYYLTDYVNERSYEDFWIDRYDKTVTRTAAYTATQHAAWNILARQNKEMKDLRHEENTITDDMEVDEAEDEEEQAQRKLQQEAVMTDSMHKSSVV